MEEQNHADKCHADIHQRCQYRESTQTTSFKLHNIQNAVGNHITEKKTLSPVLLFVLKGFVNLKVNKQSVGTVSTGQFSLIPGNSYIMLVSSPGSLLLTCRFSEKEPFFNCCSVSDIKSFVEKPASGACPFVSLPIHPRLAQFIEFLQACLSDGLHCSHFLSLKRHELFLLLYNYYPYESLARMFRPLFCSDTQFEQFVYDNYRDVVDVRHFAAIVHMPMTTFQRKFKRHFNTSAKQWLLDRKAEDILADIKDSSMLISDLAMKYNFSSLSYFSNFCKHYFGKTPTELRTE